MRSDVLSKLRDLVRSLTSQSELNDLLVLESLESSSTNNNPSDHQQSVRQLPPPPIITATTDITKLFLKSVEGSLSGGIPTNNNRDDEDGGSKRDSAEFLDLLSSILRRSSSILSSSASSSTNGTIRKYDGNVGFFHLYAVGHLSRNLAYIAQQQRRAVTTTSTSTSLSSSLSSCSMRQRMKGLNVRTLNDIVSCATQLVQSSSIGSSISNS